MKMEAAAAAQMLGSNVVLKGNLSQQQQQQQQHQQCSNSQQTSTTPTAKNVQRRPPNVVTVTVSKPNPKTGDKKLKKEFEKVSMQNETLATLIKSKNSEIKELKNCSRSLQSILNAVPDDGFHYNPVLANHKLVEVNNQNRKLNVELMATKKQLNKKDIQLKQKDMNIRMMEKQLKKIRSFDFAKSNSTELRGHMNDLDKMIATVHAKNVELSAQLREALKCLQLETGHKWDLKEFIYNSTDWQGRAQKIEDLEFQVKQYNDQVESYKRLLNLDVHTHKQKQKQKQKQKEENHDYDEDDDEDSKYDTISSEEIIQRAKIKTLEAENETLRRDLDKMKSNAVNLRVRNDSLNKEVLQCRTLICAIEQNSSQNKSNMASLRDVVIHQQKEYEKIKTDLNAEINSLKKSLSEAKRKEKIVLTKLEASEQDGKEKSKRIDEILAKYEKLENDLKSFCGGFLFSCRDLHKEEFIGILESLENEKKHLLSKVLDLEERLDNEIMKKENVLQQARNQKTLIDELKIKLNDRTYESTI